MSIDDLTIETSDGEVTEIGISDLWFDVTWENIVQNELSFWFWFDSPITGNDMLGACSFDVSVDGTSTYGYGEQFAGEYDINLDDSEPYDSSPPINVPLSTDSTDILESLELADDENEKTIENMSFEIDIRVGTGIGAETINTTSSEFDVTVLRNEPDGDVIEGEGEAFGES